MRRHAIQPNLQYDLIYHPNKCGTHHHPHKSVPQNFSTEEIDYVRERIYITIRNMMRKRARNNIILFRPTPAVPNTIYVTIRSLISTTIIDFECLTQDQFSHFPASDFPIHQSTHYGTHTYAFRECRGTSHGNDFEYFALNNPWRPTNFLFTFSRTDSEKHGQ